jgi:Zn-dependent protease with chaperone function/type II secretory pathway pseudopilin PulG
MDELIYPRERTLGRITLVLGLIGWLCLILGTVGVALIGLLVGFIVYLIAHSTLISHIKGNGVELSAAQFPDLHAQFLDCVRTLGITDVPEAYVLNGNGGLNAFATKFLRSRYVVVYSDVVDAMEKHPDGVRFYFGHELGHLRMKHLSGQLWRWPALWLPLLGAAYSRARESTCDRHGRACCSSPRNAAHALAALSAGVTAWQRVDVPAFVEQTRHSSGFWMSFHELTAGYPWLTKRAARIVDQSAPLPRRSPFAYLLAVFVPYAGRLGGGFGLLVMVYIVAILAAIAIPAYQDYTVRTRLGTVLAQTAEARQALGSYYERNKRVPVSLMEVQVAPRLADGTPLELDPQRMVLTVTLPQGKLILDPSRDAGGHIVWHCVNGEGLRPNQLPQSCRAGSR